MTFQIKPAVRKGTPALIAISGPSGSGKTFSAILVARGLVGPKGKIIVVDTENKRAEFYADLAGGWNHLDFQPPFSPARYREAMTAAENASATAIIIDSTSHVWEGEGGVLDMADRNNYTGLLKWQAPKMEYKRMLNALLRAPVHVIFCLREKEKVKQVRNQKGETEIISDGQTPICEKGFIYEMTVWVQLNEKHEPAHVKCPEDLLPALPLGKMLSVETGENIAEWVGGGAPVDAEVEHLQRIAREVATLGTGQAKKHWESLTGAQRKMLLPIRDELKATAAQADQDAQEKAPEADDDDNPFGLPAPAQAPEGGTNPLDDEFTGDKQAAE